MGPLPGGTTGQFVGAPVASHYISVVCLLEIIPAVLLFVNRFVPLALTLLAPVIVNIFLPRPDEPERSSHGFARDRSLDRRGIQRPLRIRGAVPAAGEGLGETAQPDSVRGSYKNHVSQ